MDVKVGDSVRLLCDDDCDAYERGDIVMVNEVDDDGIYFNDNDDDMRYLLFENIELVAVADSNGNVEHGNRFKVGDRVRALDSCGGGGFVAGDVYTVSRVYEDYSGPRINVEVDSVGSKTNGWGAWHFKLVDAPLTIRSGAFYRTRDGRKVGPAIRNHFNDTTYPWNVPHDGGFHGYANDGKSCLSDMNDIIAEWTDEPATTPTPTTGFTVPLDAPEFGGAENQFKVGDRVVGRAGFSFDGEMGTIVRFNDEVGKYEVRIDGVPDPKDGESWFHCESELRLVAEATNAQEPPTSIADIVRRLERLESAMWQRAA